MKLDAALAIDAAHLRDVATIVRAAEEVGFAGLWTPETQHNGFYPLLLAAEHSQRIELGTAVAIAFPRSPLVMAQNAWDLQALSGGRFILGLGTQVKAHIERRYSVPWDAPVARLRDYIAAMRAMLDEAKPMPKEPQDVTLVVVLVWGVVHELVHRWSVRKLQGSVAEITRRMLASVVFAAPAPDARDQG